MPDYPQPTSHLGIYRSGLTSSKHRRFITIGRSDIVDDTIETLRSNSKKRSKHHYLFIGARGIGKTHLLSLIEDRVVEDNELAASYVVARFPEESNRTLSFADFLLGLCEILKHQLPDEPLWQQLYSKIETEENNSVIVDTVVPALRKDNRDRKRTIIVMLENVNEVFGNQIRSKTDIAALRKFLMDANGCLLIATAPIHFDAITDVGQPFYDFFDTQVLNNLSEDETISLIRRNLEWDKRSDLLEDFDSMRPRLLALYRMTGGSPRLIVMLYELIAHESITEVQQQFRILLDRITPFYQDRLRDLAPQERALLETMATMRDQGKTPAAISARMRLSQQQTSSILKRLLKARYLTAHTNPADKRSRLYTIREGFFDIWLAMNLSRGARKRLPFLLDFFGLFYPSYEQREKKRAELADRMANDNDPDAAVALDYLSEVGPDSERATSKLGAVKLYADKGDVKEVSQYIREARQFEHNSVGNWIVRNNDQANYTDYLSELKEMIECWEHHRTGNLESFTAKLVAMGAGLNYRTWSEAKLSFLQEHVELISDSEERIYQRLRIGRLLNALARWEEAKPILQLALSEAEELDEDTVISSACNDLAELLHDTNCFTEAEPLMRRALKIIKACCGENHPKVATALNNLADLLENTNRLSEAEQLMRSALEIDEASYGENHPKVAIDLNHLAILQATDRPNEAEPLMRRSLEINEASYGEDHPSVAVDLHNLADLLMATNRLSEAEPLMHRSLEINEACYGEDHPSVAAVLNNLALLLQKTNRLSEAEPLVRRALETTKAFSGENHPGVAVYLNNLADLLMATNRPSEAEPLMARCLAITVRFHESTGHMHPELDRRIANYRYILKELGQSPAEIEKKISSVTGS